MSPDATNTIDGQGLNESGSATHDSSVHLALASDPGHHSSDEHEREEEYQKAMRALLDRSCKLIADAKDERLPAATRNCPARALQVANPSREATGPREGDTPSSLPSRATSRESTTDVAMLRDVARSSARQALGLYEFQRLFSSACGKLVLALIALLVSVVAQFLTPTLLTVAVALAAWLGGALWTIQYWSSTRQLTRRYAHTFADPEE